MNKHEHGEPDPSPAALYRWAATHSLPSLPPTLTVTSPRPYSAPSRRAWRGRVEQGGTNRRVSFARFGVFHLESRSPAPANGHNALDAHQSLEMSQAVLLSHSDNTPPGRFYDNTWTQAPPIFTPLSSTSPSHLAQDAFRSPPRWQLTQAVQMQARKLSKPSQITTGLNLNTLPHLAD